MESEHIYKIIRRLADGLVPAEHRNKILYWLFRKGDDSSKDEALFRLWNETDGSGISNMDINASLSYVKERLGISLKKKKSYNIYSLFRYAAIFLLPLVSGLIVWLVMSNASYTTSNIIECFVPNGRQKEIILSDGTKVKLNSGTLFIYPEEFDGKERRVFLSGEAYFDVQHDESNPFVVRTGRLNVKVLGTSFNINAYPDNSCITTTLNKGKVKVYCPDKEKSGITIHPDEKLVYNSEKDDFDLSEINADDYSSWTKGEIRFIKQPLSEIFKTIGRNYNVEFRYDDKIDLKELYTICFNIDEPIEQVVHILLKLIGEDKSYSIDGDVIYLRTTEKGGIGK